MKSKQSFDIKFHPITNQSIFIRVLAITDFLKCVISKICRPTGKPPHNEGQHGETAQLGRIHKDHDIEIDVDAADVDVDL